MIKLILFGVLLFALVTVIRIYRTTPPAQRRQLGWKLGLGVAAVMLILLAATGRVHWLGAVLGALLPLTLRMAPLLLRFLPQLKRLYQQHQGPQHQGPRTSAKGQRSEVKSEHLRMVLDHASNELSGEVIAGPYAGQSLDALSLEQLQNLLSYLQGRDTESIKLLVSYLNHRFGSGWQNNGDTHQAASSGDMDRNEALAILGLTGEPSRENIIQAHRRLMQKVHPDRGGNDYLAAQINHAKDLLLGD